MHFMGQSSGSEAAPFRAGRFSLTGRGAGRDGLKPRRYTSKVPLGLSATFRDFLIPHCHSEQREESLSLPSRSAVAVLKPGRGASPWAPVLGEPMWPFANPGLGKDFFREDRCQPRHCCGQDGRPQGAAPTVAARRELGIGYQKYGGIAS
jgi:hypothetical protein